MVRQRGDGRAMRDLGSPRASTYFEYLWLHRGDRPGLEADLASLHDFIVQEGVGPAVVAGRRTCSPPTPTTAARSPCMR